MALVTYILLAALHSGLNSRFHPEILGVTASKALAVVLLDFFFVKGGCYFLNIQVRRPCHVDMTEVAHTSNRDRARSWISWRTTATNSSGTSSRSVSYRVV